MNNPSNTFINIHVLGMRRIEMFNFTNMLSALGFDEGDKFVTNLEKMNALEKLIPSHLKLPNGIMEDIVSSPLLYQGLDNSLFIGQMSDKIEQISGGGLYLPVQSGALVLLSKEVLSNMNLCAGVLGHELNHALILERDPVEKIAASLCPRTNPKGYTDIEIECDLESCKRDYRGGIALKNFLKEKLDTVEQPDAKLHFQSRIYELEKYLGII